MRKMLALSLAVLLITSVLVLPSKPVAAAEQTRYGYSLLTNDTQRSAYQDVVNGIKELNPEITLSHHATNSTMQSTVNDAQYAIKMVIKDWPEFFWFNGAYNISAGGTANDVTIVVKPQYILNGQPITAGSSQFTTAKNQVNQAVSAALSTIPKNASDYEIALALHDYIIDHVEYVQVGDHQTVYGALVNGKAVCAGYARAYQLLLLEAGIPCSYIQGKSNDPQTGNLVNHAWNLVWLDGKCYYTDVTWDDQADNGVFHEYLNLSKEEISNTHFLNSDEILPASCGHDDYRFFIKNAGKGICDIRDHKEDAEVADCFLVKSIDGRNAVYYCTIHYHKDDFNTWFNSHYQSIAQKLGFESYSCDLVEVGHEHHVVYTGTLADSTPTPSVTPTESRPAPQPTESTQQTQSTQSSQSTVQTNQPTQTPISPTQSATETTGGGAAQSPTDPIPTTEPTVPTNPTDPVEPTSETQMATDPAASLESTQPNTNPSSDEPQKDTTDSDEEQPEESGSLVIGIVSGIVVVGGGAAAWFVIRKRRP